MFTKHNRPPPLEKGRELYKCNDNVYHNIMIVKKEEKSGVMIYTIREDKSEAEIDKRAGSKLTEKDRKNMFIIDHDADVFLEDGTMLIRFRKNKLNKEHVDAFWDNVIQFARKETANRGTASGSKVKNLKTNPKIKSNIIGYFDTLAPSQKLMLSRAGIKLDMSARETSFLRDYPEQYEKLVPLVKDIDKYYAKYAPDH